MDALETWFGPLNLAIAGSEAAADGIGPNAQEAKLLLDIGKVAAERGPQRYYAMLTAFSIGRALGRAESAHPGIDGTDFLRIAAGKLDVSDIRSRAITEGKSDGEGRIDR